MKIRRGLVSNSSTSSFVAIIQMDAHKEVMETLSPFVREIVERVIEIRDVFGQEVVVFHQLADAGDLLLPFGGSEWGAGWYDEPIEGHDSEYDAFHNGYLGKIPDDKVVTLERCYG